MVTAFLIKSKYFVGIIFSSLADGNGMLSQYKLFASSKAKAGYNFHLQNSMSVRPKCTKMVRDERIAFYYSKKWQ